MNVCILMFLKIFLQNQGQDRYYNTTRHSLCSVDLMVKMFFESRLEHECSSDNKVLKNGQKRVCKAYHQRRVC